MSGVLRSWWLIALAALILAPGCRRADRSLLGQIEGAVRYQGNAVSEGTLIFEVGGARPAYGKIVDGCITEVSTYQDGDGVPIGLARIAVFVQEPPESSPRSSPSAHDAAKSADTSLQATSSRTLSVTSLIPERYNDPATSGLTCEVHAGKNQVLLELQDQ